MRSVKERLDSVRKVNSKLRLENGAYNSAKTHETSELQQKCKSLETDNMEMAKHITNLLEQVQSL